MLKAGQMVLVKHGLKYVKAIVISVETDFVSLDVNYNRDKGTILRLRKDSKDIIKLDLTSKEIYKGNFEKFTSNNFFQA